MVAKSNSCSYTSKNQTFTSVLVIATKEGIKSQGIRCRILFDKHGDSP